MSLDNIDEARELERGADEMLDVTGLPCPMPLLKARQALAGLTGGKHLHVMCTDPGSWRDFESFAAQSSHQLAARRLDEGVYHYVLIKG